MVKKAQISSDWLADRADLHDANTRRVEFVGKSLRIEIDSEWPNLNEADQDRPDYCAGWLVFDEVELFDGNPQDAASSVISELKLTGELWELFLARKGLFSKRGRLAFRAQNATFQTAHQ